MEIKVINAVKTALAPTNTPFCIVNEAALNYYNVPRVIMAIEICVPECDLPITASQLASYADVFRSHPWPDEASCNTDYLRPYPRFQAFIEGQSFSVIVLPDTFYHLDPLRNNIVQIQTYPLDQIRFSRQFDFSKNLDTLSSIPVPRLATLLQGAAQRYLESKEYAMAVCVEELVDGMNLDETWCLNHLDTEKNKVVECILDRIASKGSRISEFQPGNITCFVETEEEARDLRMIPGYDEPSWTREQQTKPKEIQNFDPRLTPGWLQSALLFLKTAISNLKSAIFHQSPSHPVYFQFVSDLHLEDGQRYETFVITRIAPYLILAGDIGCLCNYKEYVAFLAEQCTKFDHVFLVLGNHEFYWMSHQDGLQAAKSLEVEPQLLGKLTVLNRNRVDINRRVTILGCTLWSQIPEDSQLWVRMKIADFSMIKDWTVEAHNTEHNKDVQWLQQELYNISLEGTNRDVIVATHHAPSFLKTADPRLKSQPWRSAFCSDLLESQVKSWRSSNAIRWWIFGHTHWNTAFRYRGMNIHSNQFKYDSQRVQEPGFFSFWLNQLGKHFVVTKVAKV
ncbi:predicted protein [Uncinocarpus reesii 1704]|uniref:Calcineurin-like phosphoesterase domain-containing protein n=1 Tax=Uncinocarpus reesii (strain UAMH 1704) TaxID=336963 RepID=C4JGA2_UNCRE|nr:uncharacterized protein UREG_02500 [Uncinocarpus reesii 1704]EEP77651.1 predicted protein [Uncinocarpus reesii 1704]